MDAFAKRLRSFSFIGREDKTSTHEFIEILQEIQSYFSLSDADILDIVLPESILKGEALDWFLQEERGVPFLNVREFIRCFKNTYGRFDYQKSWHQKLDSRVQLEDESLAEYVDTIASYFRKFSIPLNLNTFLDTFLHGLNSEFSHYRDDLTIVKSFQELHAMVKDLDVYVNEKNTNLAHFSERLPEHNHDQVAGNTNGIQYDNHIGLPQVLVVDVNIGTENSDNLETPLFTSQILVSHESKLETEVLPNNNDDLSNVLDSVSSLFDLSVEIESKSSCLVPEVNALSDINGEDAFIQDISILFHTFSIESKNLNELSAVGEDSSKLLATPFNVDVHIPSFVKRKNTTEKMDRHRDDHSISSCTFPCNTKEITQTIPHKGMKSTSHELERFALFIGVAFCRFLRSVTGIYHKWRDRVRIG